MMGLASELPHPGVAWRQEETSLLSRMTEQFALWNRTPATLSRVNSHNANC